MTGFGPAIQVSMLRCSQEVDVREPDPNSRRLLCVHFFDNAGLEINPDAVDLVEISPGYADEARVVRIVNRVNGAVLIDSGFARREPVLFGRFELGVLGVCPVVLTFPLDHVRVFGGLAVDSPGGAMIMRRRDPRLVVDVCKNPEA